MSANYRLIGAEDLARKIHGLPKDLQRAAESSVLRAGAAPVARIAKAKAPKESGLLKKSIGYRVRKVKGVINARIGPRRGFRQEVPRVGTDGKSRLVMSDPNNYAHLVELGTSHSPAQPFIRPALESAKGDALAAMAKNMGIFLEKQIRKMRARKR
jgi:HK97 gp10 family phage protein